MNSCEPQPGIDAHAQRQIEKILGHLGQRIGPRGRGQRRPGSAAGVADGREGVVQVLRRLEVHGDVVGTGARDVADVALGALDHHVHIHDRTRRVDEIGDRPHRDGSEGDGGNEVTVHHVDVDHARPGLQHLVDLGTQPREVG